MQDQTLDELTSWANSRDAVRAVILTGSRANPHAHIDAFSDYDVILVVHNIHPFVEDKSWLEDFGEVLAVYWDPVHPQPDTDIDCSGNVTQYASGLHIDFTLWPPEIIQRLIDTKRLSNDLDVGYTVLLDKDGNTEALLPATGNAYLKSPPSEQEFLQVVGDFLSDVPYMVKSLYRDELFPIKWCLDHDMKHNFLLPLLEWRAAIEQGWQQPSGMLGRGLKQNLPAEIWCEVESTYVGADAKANWQALFKSLGLFKKAGIQVAAQLGYAYPESRHQKVHDYALRIYQSL